MAETKREMDWVTEFERAATSATPHAEIADLLARYGANRRTAGFEACREQAAKLAQNLHAKYERDYELAVGLSSRDWAQAKGKATWDILEKLRALKPERG